MQTDTSCIKAQQDHPLHIKYSMWPFQTLWGMEKLCPAESQLIAAWYGQKWLIEKLLY